MNRFILKNVDKQWNAISNPIPEVVAFNDGLKRYNQNVSSSELINITKIITFYPYRRPNTAGAMELRLMQEVNKRGLKPDMDEDGDIDELDRLKQIEIVREMPVPIYAKRQMRYVIFLYFCSPFPLFSYNWYIY